MTTRETAARVRSLIEDGIGRGDHQVIDAIVAPDCIEHQRGHAPGVEGVHGLATRLHGWAKDFSLRVVDIDVAGDRGWVRNLATGTHTGPVMGFGPTHRRFEVEVFDMMRVVDGRVVEHWGLADQLGMLQQLGVAPATSASRTNQAD